MLAQQAKFSKSASTNPNPPHHLPKNIAVLGGGITGLATAHYLTRELPNANITVYEGSDKLGGWLCTKHVDVGNGTVVFERGPRSIRPAPPAGLVTLEMIKKLGLEDEILMTSLHSHAAQNRYIYYPDHLVRMPGPKQDVFQMGWEIIMEPVFKGLIFGVLSELGRPGRSPALDDESIGSFLERRLGTTRVGDNIVSAVFHGIYAGDIYQLSAKSLLSSLWHQEGQAGSVVQGTVTNMRDMTLTMPYRDALLLQEFQERREDTMVHKMSSASVYTFKKGIGALSEALESSLKANPNVQFKMGHKIKKLEYDNEIDGIQISSDKNQPRSPYSNVISTISGRSLSYLTKDNTDLLSLRATKAVTVMVVNIYYADPNVLDAHGFGYLIPRSISYEQNPEFALGVVFDSDAVIGQDTVPGTKVTVMLGGHWWDEFASYPDEEEGAAMARAVLRRHLGVTDDPTMVHVSLQRECIPQYTVGHESRMKSAHQELTRTFRGKLAVAGNSYTGVGLNDCVRAARDVVLDVTQFEGQGGVTGLEQFATERRWVKTKPITVLRES